MHMRFKTLDFIITTEGELVWALAPAQPTLTIGLDAIDGAIEELQLHALELAGGEPLSLTHLTQNASIVLSFTCATPW
jgi:hypothetical protein